MFFKRYRLNSENLFSVTGPLHLPHTGGPILRLNEDQALDLNASNNVVNYIHIQLILAKNMYQTGCKTISDRRYKKCLNYLPLNYIVIQIRNINHEKGLYWQLLKSVEQFLQEERSRTFYHTKYMYRSNGMLGLQINMQFCTVWAFWMQVSIYFMIFFVWYTS